MQKDERHLDLVIFGAGVLGSLYAALLKEAGHSVTLVARGRRYEDLMEHGIVLERFDTGERATISGVRVVDRMPDDESFDACIVLVQRTQIEEALPALAANSRIPAFVFMHNMLDGPRALIDALGEDRVLLGHANAGGERDGHVVKYMLAERMMIGELDGSRTGRVERIAHAFESAGVPVDISGDPDAWKRCHVGLVSPFANAMYMVGGCNYRLAHDTDALKLCVKGIREGLKVVRSHGFTVEPRRLRAIFFIPQFVLVPLFRRVLDSELMDIGGARHARAAREEMAQLSQELLDMAEESGVETPILRELHAYTDEGRAPLLPMSAPARA